MKRNIDWIILGALGLFCYLYSIFFSYFAELNLQLPFLNFPIFIGEILLVFCVVALFIKWKIYSLKLNRWHYLLAAYILFILTKAFYGYYREGPLAFRNAALFYYFLYAVIGYYFYNGNFFKDRFIVSISLFLLISTFLFTKAHKAYYFNYFIFILLFLMGMRNKKARYISIILVSAICYEGILVTIRGGRNILVSSSLAYIFIFIILISNFINVKTKYKRWSLLTVFLFGSLTIWNFSGDKLAIKSLFYFKEIYITYKDYLEELKAKEKNFEFANPPVKVYEKNSDYAERRGSMFSIFKPKVDIGNSVAKRIQRPVIESQPSPDNSTDREKMSAILEKVNRAALVKHIQEHIVENQTASAGTTLSDRIRPAATFKDSDNAALVKHIQEHIVENQTVSAGTMLSDKEKIVAVLERIDKHTLAKNIQESIVENQTVSAGTTLSDKDKIVADIERIDKPTLVKYIRVFVTESQPKKIEYRLKLSDFQLNIIYRLFISGDMLEEIIREKEIFGANFGKPFRSKKLELARFDEDWKTRVGWVEPHNAYVHMIYRAGIVGLLFIIVVVGMFCAMVIRFVRVRNIKGIFLTSVLLYWLTISNFMVILELPYSAIPFWTLFGLVLRYSDIQKDRLGKESLI